MRFGVASRLVQSRELIEDTPVRGQGVLRAANCKMIYNEGHKLATMMTREGALRDMNFTVRSVTGTLGPVSQMCRPGNNVLVDPPWGPDGALYRTHGD